VNTQMGHARPAGRLTSGMANFRSNNGREHCTFYIPKRVEAKCTMRVWPWHGIDMGVDEGGDVRPRISCIQTPNLTTTSSDVARRLDPSFDVSKRSFQLVAFVSCPSVDQPLSGVPSLSYRRRGSTGRASFHSETRTVSLSRKTGGKQDKGGESLLQNLVPRFLSSNLHNRHTSHTSQSPINIALDHHVPRNHRRRPGRRSMVSFFLFFLSPPLHTPFFPVEALLESSNASSRPRRSKRPFSSRDNHQVERTADGCAGSVCGKRMYSLFWI
jgi:hypothetical protein